MSDSFEDALQHANITFLNFARSVALLLEAYANALEESDAQLDRENWKRVIEFAILAGISEDDMRGELGASLDTLHRWLHEGVRPRFRTRTVMAKTMADVLRQKHGFNEQPV